MYDDLPNSALGFFRRGKPAGARLQPRFPSTRTLPHPFAETRSGVDLASLFGISTISQPMPVHLGLRPALRSGRLQALQRSDDAGPGAHSSGNGCTLAVRRMRRQA